MLILLGLALLAGAAWEAWCALVAPESIPLPPQVMERQIQERQKLLSRTLSSGPPRTGVDLRELREAADREDEAKLKELEDALKKETEALQLASEERQRARKAERESLEQKHAAEAQDERTKGVRRALFQAAVLLLGGVLLIGTGIGAWSRPAARDGTASNHTTAPDAEPGVAADPGRKAGPDS